MAPPQQKFVGRSVLRLEDRPLLTGTGRFAADISFPEQLHMRVVRSAHAHARVVAVHANDAAALPGVHAIWTAADVAHIPPIDFRLTKLVGLEAYRQRALATDRLRYVGEPVAVVFADSSYVAEDAAELVQVDVEELVPVLDALAEPQEFDDGLGSEPAVIRKGFGLRRVRSV